MPTVFISPRNVVDIKVDDMVISKNGQVGIVEKMHSTGQVLVALLRNGKKSGVYCTYDDIHLLTKVNRSD